ncbi:hypothetical protein HPB51_006308 [Rhipicephalus microplus]|uniref:Ubiquitin carboxyl-terminal hydrolase n=1 Tax=Rhipicephalus microplus TaxID=6941 RepID=A0A9J6ENF4_RHIMP|nr:hypothetical protein HPB51_006308 [Rhipicephalus microplus]
MEQPSTQQQEFAPVGGGAGAETVSVSEASDAAAPAQAEAAFPTETTTSCTSPSAEQPPQSVYHIKWVRWNNQKTPIVTQAKTIFFALSKLRSLVDSHWTELEGSHKNENGPCPLIAIINVLTLKGLVKLPQTLDIVTVEQLMEHLGDCILSSIPKDIPESAQLNYEQNMHDAIAILPKLQTGLDVNVRFTGVKDFEYTPECIVFDLLRIPLYHGWLLDPESPEILAAVGSCSYNQLVEKIINNKSSTKPEMVTEGMSSLLAEAFLERTASQLTYHGLCELNSTLTEDELCVLFRNNHFITLYKRKDRLYQLVTDQGFLNEPDVVWESLINVEGDGQFADSDFIVNPPKPRCLTTEQQIDRDYLVALSLHHEQVHHERTKNDALQSFVQPVEPLDHNAIRAEPAGLHRLNWKQTPLAIQRLFNTRCLHFVPEGQLACAQKDLPALHACTHSSAWTRPSPWLNSLRGGCAQEDLCGRRLDSCNPGYMDIRCTASPNNMPILRCPSHRGNARSPIGNLSGLHQARTRHLRGLPHHPGRPPDLMRWTHTIHCIDHS